MRKLTSRLAPGRVLVGLEADEFDRIVDPNTMVGDPRRDLASAIVP